MLKDREGLPAAQLHVNVMGSVLLMTAEGGLSGSRLDELLGQIGRTARCVVLDLSDVDTVDRAATDALRKAWRTLGNRLRVVAPTDGELLQTLKQAGLRRFAIHSSLSGALAQADADSHT